MTRRLAEALDLISFFTAGEKETRAWTLRRGQTALEAADSIHSDIARGFIRAEVIRWDAAARVRLPRRGGEARPDAPRRQDLRRRGRRRAEHPHERLALLPTRRRRSPPQACPLVMAAHGAWTRPVAGALASGGNASLWAGLRRASVTAPGGNCACSVPPQLIPRGRAGDVAGAGLVHGENVAFSTKMAVMLVAR